MRLLELLQPWRGGRLTAAQLERAGHPLAIARVQIPRTARLVDLCDPAILEDLAVGPDVTAPRLRERTQPIARSAWDRGGDGLRWWSSFWATGTRSCSSPAVWGMPSGSRSRRR